MVRFDDKSTNALARIESLCDMAASACARRVHAKSANPQTRAMNKVKRELEAAGIVMISKRMRVGGRNGKQRRVYRLEWNTHVKALSPLVRYNMHENDAGLSHDIDFQ